MPETIVELGKRVKAKYPGQYDDLPDDALGRKIKAKYPGAYDDFSDTAAVPAKTGAGERFATGVKQTTVDPIVQAVSHPIDTAVGAFSHAAGIGDLKKIAEHVSKRDFKQAGMSALKFVSQTPSDRIAAGIVDPIVKNVQEGNLAGAGGQVVGNLIMAAAPKVIPKAVSAVERAAPIVKGAAVEGFKAATSPRTMMGAGTAEYVASHMGLPNGIGAAAVAGPKIAKAVIRGGKAAMGPKPVEIHPSVARPPATVPAPAVEAAPAPPGSVTAAEVAQLTPEKFAKLPPPDQAAAQAVADRYNASLKPEAQPALTSQPAAQIPEPLPSTPPAAPPLQTAAQAPLTEPVESATSTQKTAILAPSDRRPPTVAKSAIVDTAEQLREMLVPGSKSGEVATIAAPEPEFAPSVYEASARAAKVQNLAKALHDNGITWESAQDIPLKGTAEAPGWDAIAKSLGENMPSDTAIEHTLFELKKLSKPPASATAPKPKVRRTKK